MRSGPALDPEALQCADDACFGAAAAAQKIDRLLLATVANGALRLRRIPLPAGTGMVGTDSVVGETGRVEADLDPVGTVYVGRESWTARERNGAKLARGQEVRVVGQEGLTLIVEKA